MDRCEDLHCTAVSVLLKDFFRPCMESCESQSSTIFIMLLNGKFPRKIFTNASYWTHIQTAACSNMGVQSQMPFTINTSNSLIPKHEQKLK